MLWAGFWRSHPGDPRDLEATLPEDAQGTESWGRFFPARAVGFWGERGSPASASTGASRPHRDPPSLFLAAQACPEGQLFGQPRVDTKHLMYTRPPWVGPPPPGSLTAATCYLPTGCPTGGTWASLPRRPPTPLARPSPPTPPASPQGDSVSSSPHLFSAWGWLGGGRFPTAKPHTLVVGPRQMEEAPRRTHTCTHAGLRGPCHRDLRLR